MTEDFYVTRTGVRVDPRRFKSKGDALLFEPFPVTRTEPLAAAISEGRVDGEDDVLLIAHDDERATVLLREQMGWSLSARRSRSSADASSASSTASRSPVCSRSQEHCGGDFMSCYSPFTNEESMSIALYTRAKRARGADCCPLLRAPGALRWTLQNS